MILDTCFFIDEQRRLPETREFLLAHPSEQLYLTVVTAGELACGFSETDLHILWSHLSRFEILMITPEASAQYGRIYRRLRASGGMIGANDLWIASVALANKLPLVTRNVAEFGRVPGLRVVAY